jgi:hypothetical protein
MSTPEEHIATSKPKRKYTKRAKVDMPPAAPVSDTISSTETSGAFRYVRESILRVRESSPPHAEELQDLSLSINAYMAEKPSSNSRAKIQNELAVLRECLPEAGEALEAAMSKLWGIGQSETSSGLQPASTNNLAMQEMPSGRASVAFEHTCTVPISSHIGTANNGDRIKMYEYCQNEAKYVPTIHFTGLREDPSPHNPKKLIPTETHVATRFGAVCEMHRQKIQTDINVLVDSRELESLSGQYYREGFGTPIKSKTKITWADFIPPKDDYESEHTRALQEG